MPAHGRAVLRRLFFLLLVGAPLAAWPLLAWLHSATGADASLRLSGWRLVSGAEARPVELPDEWRRRDFEGHAAVYEVRFATGTPVREPWAIYLESLGMDASVELNGREVPGSGATSARMRRNWARPLVFLLAPDAVQGGENVLRVRVASDVSSWGFLGNVFAGPASRLLPAYERRHALDVTAVWIITACQLLVAMFTAALWLRWRHEASYGWFTVAMLAWATSHLALLVADPLLPSGAWLGSFFVAVGLWAALEIRFLVAFLGDRRPLLARASLSIGAMGAAVIAVLAALDSPALVAAGLAWLSVLLALGLPTVAMTARELRDHGNDLATALPNALGLTVVPCALHDWLVLVGVMPGFDFYLPYAALPAATGMGWALLRRFVLALRESEVAVADLERRVRVKQDELEGSYRRLRDVEKKRVLADERERIMREMHDGLGSHLVTSLALIEGDSSRAALADALRGALEDLRVMVDALVPADGDLVSALAMLRARLAPRIEAGGLRVDWSVAEVPPMPGLGPHAVLQVLRIVQEAITNVLRHAGARSLVIRSGTGTGSGGRPGAFVEVSDDGRGIVAPVRDDGFASFREGRGMSSMRRRASAIGGELVVSSSAGTTVRLWMPVAGKAA